MASDFRIEIFAAVVVVEKQCVGVGLMRPAESLLDIGCGLARQTDAGLVVPRRIFHPAIFIQGFVYYIPGEDLAGIVLHYGCDVFLQDLGQLVRRVPIVSQPFGIVVIPH